MKSFQKVKGFNDKQSLSSDLEKKGIAQSVLGKESKSAGKTPSPAIPTTPHRIEIEPIANGIMVTHHHKSPSGDGPYKEPTKHAFHSAADAAKHVSDCMGPMEKDGIDA